MSVANLMQLILTPCDHEKFSRGKCILHIYTTVSKSMINLTTSIKIHIWKVSKTSLSRVSTAGNSVQRCYQISRGSSSGTVPGWHLMKTDKIIGLSVAQSVFIGPRDGYKRGDKNMSMIYEQL